MTLNELIKKHPELADLPVVVYSPDGAYDFIGDDGPGMFYEGYDHDEGVKVLVFAPN